MRTLMLSILLMLGCNDTPSQFDQKPAFLPDIVAEMEAEPAPAPAPAPEAQRDYTGTIRFKYASPWDLRSPSSEQRRDEAIVSLALRADALEIRYERIPRGTKIRVGSRPEAVVPETVDSKGDKVDIVSIGSLDTDGLDLLPRSKNSKTGAKYHNTIFELELDEPVVIEMPRYAPIVVDSWGHLGAAAFSEYFRKVTDGPLRFPGETDDKPLPGTVGILVGLQKQEHLTKYNISASEIRYVAVQTAEAPQQVIECRGYGKSVAGTTTMAGKHAVKIQLMNATYAIYDRFTGDKLAEQTFKAEGSCPKNTMTSDSGWGATLVPDRDRVARWVNKETKTRR